MLKIDLTLPHAKRNGWWVHAQATISKHRSCVGPFASAALAGEYADKERPLEDWSCVTIGLRKGVRR